MADYLPLILAMSMKTIFYSRLPEWGGGTMTAQNQRLVYWPMLKSGDFDMMPSQFDFITAC